MSATAWSTRSRRREAREVSPLALDYDLIIREGESLLCAASEHERDHYRLALAAAYHQRASRAWAAGDRVAALPDAERAVELDPSWLRYATTHALALEAAGRRDEARAKLAAATAAAPAEDFTGEESYRSHYREPDRPAAADRARALATAGLMALRAGDARAAIAALRTADTAYPSAAHAHALGAALWAAGDIAAAVEAEARSVVLEPRNARYRWALVTSLRKLGRDAEAREHAESIVAAGPEDAAHRERFRRLFGEDALARADGKLGAPP